MNRLYRELVRLKRDIRRAKRAALAPRTTQVRVVGPYCEWPRVWPHDGTCLWPHLRGPMPREWWRAKWLREGRPEVVESMHIHEEAQR